MEISALFIGLILSLSLCELNTELTGRSEVSSVKCKLQGSTRQPVFSMDGDYVIGGVFSIRYYEQTEMHNYTTMPEPQKCTGRSVGGRSNG